MNRGTQKFITPLLLCVLLLTLTGCWSSDPLDNPEDLYGLTGAEGIVDDSEAPNDSIVPITSFALPYLPDETLDPILCGDGLQQTFLPLLYEGLFELDESFTPQNMLCSDYTASDDFTVWTFTLRGGVSFSNGQALTAEDVVASLRRAMVSERYAARLAAVASVTGSGDSVTVTLSEANNRLPALLDIPIVSKSTAGTSSPAGTGPYVFTAGEDGSAALTKNADWWRKQTLPVDTIPLVAVENTNMLSYLFSSHEIQMLLTDFTGSNSVDYKGGTTVTDAATTTLLYLGFNCVNGPFTDSALRCAVSQGIYREGLVRAYLSGHALSSEFPVSPLSPWYPEELQTEYSAEAFRQAMTEAGYNSGNTVAVSMLVCDGNSFRLSVAKAIAASLSSCDLNVTIKTLPYEEYIAALQSGDFDLYYGETRMTPDFNCAALVKTGGALNYGGYSNPILDAQINAAFSSASAPSSANRTMLATIQQEAPVVPICFKSQSVIIQDGATEEITPTCGNVFYQFAAWQIHIKGETTNG